MTKSTKRFHIFCFGLVLVLEDAIKKYFKAKLFQVSAYILYLTVFLREHLLSSYSVVLIQENRRMKEKLNTYSKNSCFNYCTRTIIPRSWILTIHKASILRKKVLKKSLLTKSGLKKYKPLVMMAPVRYFEFLDLCAPYNYYG